MLTSCKPSWEGDENVTTRVTSALFSQNTVTSLMGASLLGKETFCTSGASGTVGELFATVEVMVSSECQDGTRSCATAQTPHEVGLESSEMYPRDHEYSDFFRICHCSVRRDFRRFG